METLIHKANSRGHIDHGWLDTYHTFSFANYYDPNRMQFGALRVLNDDIVLPGSGFGSHPHDNMEIITIPLKGSLKHDDSMGYGQVIKPDEVQVMTAGTGIFHSEYNASDTESVNLLQIWIFPDTRNLKPTYDQKYFDPEGAENKWQFLVDRNNRETLSIHQDARISRLFLSEGKSIGYNITSSEHGSYVFVIDGSVKLNSVLLDRRDGFGVSDVETFMLKAIEDSHLINIEVPMTN